MRTKTQDGHCFNINYVNGTFVRWIALQKKNLFKLTIYKHKISSIYHKSCENENVESRWRVKFHIYSIDRLDELLGQFWLCVYSHLSWEMWYIMISIFYPNHLHDDFHSLDLGSLGFFFSSFIPSLSLKLHYSFRHFRWTMTHLKLWHFSTSYTLYLLNLIQTVEHKFYWINVNRFGLAGKKSC